VPAVTDTAEPNRTELEQAALEGLAAKAESWQPVREKDHPNVIVGTVARIEAVERETSFAGRVTVPIVTLVGSDGTGWSVWLWQTVLANEMRRLCPQVGDVLAVEYLGKVQPDSGGSAYHSYRVSKADDGTTPDAFDWEAAAPPAEPDPGLVVRGAAASPPPAPEQPQAPAPQQPQAPQPPAAPAPPAMPDDDIPF
jgi:hypothetical protein